MTLDCSFWENIKICFKKNLFWTCENIRASQVLITSHIKSDMGYFTLNKDDLKYEIEKEEKQVMQNKCLNYLINKYI